MDKKESGDFPFIIIAQLTRFFPYEVIKIIIFGSKNHILSPTLVTLHKNAKE